MSENFPVTVRNKLIKYGNVDSYFALWTKSAEWSMLANFRLVDEYSFLMPRSICH